MAWNPYTDYKNRGFSHILTTLFPEQTRTLPRILVWSVIFLIDLALGIFGAYHFGFLNDAAFQEGWLRWLLLPAIIAVFWLQGWIWQKIMGLFR